MDFRSNELAIVTDADEIMKDSSEKFVHNGRLAAVMLNGYSWMNQTFGSFFNQHGDPRNFPHKYEDSLDELREIIQAGIHGGCRLYPARDLVDIPELRDAFEQAKRDWRSIQKPPKLSTLFWQRRTLFDI